MHQNALNQCMIWIGKFKCVKNRLQECVGVFTLALLWSGKEGLMVMAQVYFPE